MDAEARALWIPFHRSGNGGCVELRMVFLVGMRGMAGGKTTRVSDTDIHHVG